MTVRQFIISAKKERLHDVDFFASIATVSYKVGEYDAVCETILNETKERWPEADGWINHKYDDAGELKKGYLLQLAANANP